MSKNPFEIRAEMLQLAKEYMDQQYHMNFQLLQDLFAQGKIQMEELKLASKLYSSEELLAKAKEFYGFVSTKDKE
jgi:hypothetical protein